MNENSKPFVRVVQRFLYITMSLAVQLTRWLQSGLIKATCHLQLGVVLLQLPVVPLRLAMQLIQRCHLCWPQPSSKP